MNEPNFAIPGLMEIQSPKFHNAQIYVPTTYNLVANVEGDSWEGIPSLFVTLRGEIPSLPVASAVMQFKRRKNPCCVDLELSTENELIQIVDADGWEFAIPPVLEFSLEDGDWFYSFRATDSAGFKRTFFVGKITVSREA